VKEPEGFREFVAARSAALVRSAWLLSGDEGTAQDLVQVALVKTWQRWSRLDRQASAEAYVRRVLLRTFLTWRRRRWHGEVPVAVMPELRATPDSQDELGTRTVVAMALGELPARQRAVVVLRYFDDLSEAETARVMGCSVGTVKSQTSKALARLRQSSLLREVLEQAEVSGE
jgi:RNA polymerase sigma-70 factor (sigma-E family)